MLPETWTKWYTQNPSKDIGHCFIDISNRHWVQETDPFFEKVFVGQSVHELDPDDEYVPSEHNVHEDDPSFEYVPAGHVSHFAFPVKF